MLKSRKENQRVVAYIAKNDENQPVARIAYDFGNGLHAANDLRNHSKEEIESAISIFNQVSSTRDEGILKYNTDRNETYSSKEITNGKVSSYVVGSEPGRENCEKTIRALAEATASLDLRIPLYVSNGNKVVFYNEGILEEAEKEAERKLFNISPNVKFQQDFDIARKKRENQNEVEGMFI